MPVVEAEAGVAGGDAAGRMPVADAAAGAGGFGAGALAGAAAAAGGDVAVPTADAIVVPHCTQNFAPG